MMYKTKSKFLSGQKMTTIFQKMTVFLLLSFCTTLYANKNVKETLTLGLTGVTLKEDLTGLLNLKNYLEKSTNKKISFKFTKSYANMKSLIKNNIVDFAYICGATYVDLESSSLIELLAVPIINKKAQYYSLIITNKDASYETIFNLKNKLFAMSDPESNSASLVPQYMLMKKGIDFNKFFKKKIYTYDHGESIDAVLSGYVDAASVDSIVYTAFLNKNSIKAKKLKIIDRFGPYPSTPFVIQKNLDETIKEQLKEAFLIMHRDRKGKMILKSMGIDSFIYDNTISYKEISEIKNFLQKKSKDD